MNFVKNDERLRCIFPVQGFEKGGIVHEFSFVILDVPVEVERIGEGSGDELGEGGLSHLTGAGEENHGFGCG